MKKPPALLIAATVVYIGYLIALLLIDFTGVVAGRLAVAAVLFFFVLRGSRVAGNILAVLCALSAVFLVAVAIPLLTRTVWPALAAIVLAVVLVLFAAYLFRSPAVRAFQRARTPAGAPPR